ncbi:MAG TPA: DUF2273 domain-containing protein [Clostridiales bacterium]|nr:DUF2273 domain-containing protein [Clostridiales bacterium]
MRDTTNHIKKYISNNKGKVIGVILGLVFAILVLSIGFFKSLFIALCVFIGYYIGNKFDKKEKFLDFLDKILPTIQK